MILLLSSKDFTHWSVRSLRQHYTLSQRFLRMAVSQNSNQDDKEDTLILSSPLANPSPVGLTSLASSSEGPPNFVVGYRTSMDLSSHQRKADIISTSHTLVRGVSISLSVNDCKCLTWYSTSHPHSEEAEGFGGYHSLYLCPLGDAGER